jgi:hypothetical protein
MGVLDIFSGEKGRDTAIWGAGTTQAGATRQRGYLGTGAAQGLAALGQGYKQARSDIPRRYTVGQNALNAGRNASLGVMNRNPALIQQYGANADAFYAPLGEEANRGFSVYGDAAGVNGAAGQDRATQNFRAGPGYNFQLNQGIDASTRAAAAAGMAASGNTMQAAQRYGSGLADQEFQKYMQNLQPYLQLAPGIAGKRADIQTGMSDDLIGNNAAIAGLYTGHGKDTAALQMGEGNTLASLATGYGTNQAGLYGDLSRNLSNVTGAETAMLTQQGQAGLMAGQTANQNTWNAGLQLANLAAGNASKAASVAGGKSPFA